MAGVNLGIVTGCYWDSTPETGIGAGSGNVTKVDGTDIKWDDAIKTMNATIEAWKYEFTRELSTLTR